MKIATWNVDQPKAGGWVKDRIRQVIATIGADLWILTETTSAIDLGQSHPYWAATTPISSRPPQIHHSAVIWSTWQLQPVQIEAPPTRAVCALGQTPGGPLLVYGAIIPYHAHRGQSGTAKNWEEHYRAIEVFNRDWAGLRRQYPGVPLCVAGDFNQDRDGSGWYGTGQGRAMLTQALSDNGLVCLTEENFRAAKNLNYRNSVDHICLSAHRAAHLAVGAWDEKDEQGRRLSDHNGVWVEFDLVD